MSGYTNSICKTRLHHLTDRTGADLMTVWRDIKDDMATDPCGCDICAEAVQQSADALPPDNNRESMIYHQAFWNGVATVVTEVDLNLANIPVPPPCPSADTDYHAGYASAIGYATAVLDPLADTGPGTVGQASVSSRLRTNDRRRLRNGLHLHNDRPSRNYLAVHKVQSSNRQPPDQHNRRNGRQSSPWSA